MKPLILKIDPLNIDHELIRQAAATINNRGLVAFPTETVYGLGASALDPKAVAAIFEAKKRPLDDPLIVHIAEMEDLYKVASRVPPEVERLVNRFWPGPLTVILRKSQVIPDIVTTGLDTVAVRMPSGKIARELIKASGVPIAAPSANLFGRPSPTDAAHVISDIGAEVDVIIDGGQTEIGVESTVVEFDGARAIILRPGGTSVEDLRSFTGEVEVLSEEEVCAKSPGKYPRHYSPRASVMIVPGGESQAEDALAAVSIITAAGKIAGVISAQEHEDLYHGLSVKVLGPASDGRICASRLFKILREFDWEGVDVIVAEAIPETGLGLAVMNRLRKAAGPSEETIDNRP